MSDNRKILIAKRHNERSKNPNFNHQNKVESGSNNSKQGLKRPPTQTPKKNLANERLKRLRLTINEEVKNSPKGQRNVSSSSSTQNKQTYQRKRPQEMTQNVNLKVPRQENTHREDVEYMEWTPTIQDIQPNVSTVCDNTDKILYIIVDTNIFLSHLQLIKDIININVTGNQEPVIFIPWIVIEELDFIKDGMRKNNLKFKAQEAVKYIETTLSNKHKRMKGQTLNDVNQQKSVGASQDNKIIACCLQIQERYGNMILLTNDINLKNKAHFNNIPVCSHLEIKGKISNKPLTKSQQILEKMTSLCTTVINECAKKSYGVACHKMSICQTSLNTLQDCISLFMKYWFPVFEEYLMKQFKKAICELSKFLTDNLVINDGTKELSELLRLCVRVCLFLKDVECCKDIIENTIRDLNNIQDS